MMSPRKAASVRIALDAPTNNVTNAVKHFKFEQRASGASIRNQTQARFSVAPDGWAPNSTFCARAGRRVRDNRPLSISGTLGRINEGTFAHLAGIEHRTAVVTIQLLRIRGHPDRTSEQRRFVDDLWFIHGYLSDDE
jgi:hypothetical protein